MKLQIRIGIIAVMTGVIVAGSSLASHASQSTRGKLTLELRDAKAGSDTWTANVHAVTYIPFDDGLLELWASQQTEVGMVGIFKVELWRGSAVPMDSLDRSYTFPAPSEQNIRIAAEVIPFPGRKTGTLGFGDELFIVQTKDTIRSACCSWTSVWAKDIRDSLAKLGLGDAPIEVIDSLAPTLADSLRSLSTKRTGPARKDQKGESQWNIAPKQTGDSARWQYTATLENLGPVTHPGEPVNASRHPAPAVYPKGPVPKSIERRPGTNGYERRTTTKTRSGSTHSRRLPDRQAWQVFLDSDKARWRWPPADQSLPLTNPNPP